MTRRAQPRILTETERDLVVRLYTDEQLSVGTIATRFSLFRSHVTSILRSSGVRLRPATSGRRNPVNEHPELHQPHVAYCALCNEKALYVYTDGSSRGGASDSHDNGHILEVGTHPKGRWVDRGDGIYASRHKPPEDATGHRPHSCRYPHRRESATTR